MGNQVVRLLHVTSCGQRDQIMIKLLDYEYYAFEGVASAAAILFLVQKVGIVQHIPYASEKKSFCHEYYSEAIKA